MIYSTNFKEICGKLNHVELSKYLVDLSWRNIPSRQSFIKIFQYQKGNRLYQVDIPVDKEIRNYNQAMYDVVAVIAEATTKSVEQVILELLNPVSDIIRVRIDNSDICDGSILFEDAITLFNNTKQLLTATAMDVVKPKKYYGSGHPVEEVQRFIEHCRFGQTEIGSYVTNVVCPFYKKINDQYEQLTLFDEKEECAQTLTRKVTNKLITSIDKVKTALDLGEDLEKLTDVDTNERISINFLEALGGLNAYKSESLLDFKIKWAPTIKKNIPTVSNVILSEEYIKPLSSITSKVIKEVKQEKTQKTYMGRIKFLDGNPDRSERKNGTVTLVYLNEKEKASNIKAVLDLEDYDRATLAHKNGKVVKIIGQMSPENHKQITNCELEILD